MVSLLEIPVFTREHFVNTLLRELARQTSEAKERVQHERNEIREQSSATDRDERCWENQGTLDKIAQCERTIQENQAFRQWLERQHFSEYPQAPGNVWILEKPCGDRLVWLICDPLAMRPGEKVYITINFDALCKEFGASEVLTLSITCPLFRRLVGKDIRVGADITVGVEGNDKEVMRLLAVL